MLVGTGAYQGLWVPMTFSLQDYHQINIYSTQAWRELPTKGEKSIDITKIIEGLRSTIKTLWHGGFRQWAEWLEILTQDLY